MYNLIITEQADKDLNEIISYIVFKLDNKKAATNFLDEIEKVYQFLKSNPFIYEKCNDKFLSDKEYRKVSIENYLLIYKIDEKNNNIFILNFFYAPRNYINLISKI